MSQIDPTTTARITKPSTFHEPNVLAMLEYLVDEYGHLDARGRANNHGRPIGADPPHGTNARYVSKRLRCRCDLCRRANANYVRTWRTRGGGK